MVSNQTGEMIILPYGGSVCQPRARARCRGASRVAVAKKEMAGSCSSGTSPDSDVEGPSVQGGGLVPNGGGESQEAVHVELPQPVLAVDLTQREWR